jgi:hypothetical protein
MSALLAVALLVVPGFTQQPPVKSVPPRAEQPVEKSLEDLISEALKNNPEIRVGEAKVREAEAELNRTRLTVAQKVAALYHSIEIARKTQEEANQKLARFQHLMKTAAVSQEEYREVLLGKERAAAELAKLEAEMPTLLGQLPGRHGGDKASRDRSTQVEPAVDAGVRWLRAVNADDVLTERGLAALALSRIRIAHDLAPQGTLADKIRKALDKPIEANYKDKPLSDVLKDFEKHLDGIPFRKGSQDPAGNMDLNLGQVPLGTAIQAYTDLMPHIRFVVRDYGILMAAKNNLPPGAVDLYDFWKSDLNKEKSKRESSEAPKPKQ